MSVRGTDGNAATDSPAGQPPELVTPEAIHVTTGDNVTFVIRLLEHEDPTVPVVLILPAMGMKAKFYRPLAKALSTAGLSAATCDLRAQGESTPGLREQPGFGYRELLEVDLPAVLAALRARLPQAPVYLFGHSLGGQLALLYTASAPKEIAGACVIATSSVYWRSFARGRRLVALWQGQVIGLVSRIRGYWPGGMVIPAPMAGGVMTDWARHIRNGRYQPRGSKRDYNEALRTFDLPVLVISIAGDPLGPRPNVDFLCGRMRAAQVTRWHIEDGSGVAVDDHFAWIRSSGVIGSAAAAWITRGALPAQA
ncbi:alpha/beta fold hydrolase [Frankia sp. CiP1_Cm_nod1]|uniref:alpha/beta fold hydrolase n=1 Tax=Frankia sp. CiP1_Cm_nod1 TaxID=2897160 RepID=UPI0020241A2E